MADCIHAHETQFTRSRGSIFVNRFPGGAAQNHAKLDYGSPLARRPQ
jgi:hypothetical protein